MKAIVFDNKLKYLDDNPVPKVQPQWALIRVIKAGICNTDLEILRGYKGFKGILGHEFVGVIEQCEDKLWIGKRVVGEINISCGICEMCQKGLPKHCFNRKVLGILNHHGCMAEYCTLPLSNFHVIPTNISDDKAVFIEPLSAACQILTQLKLKGNESAVVLGDGKIGILCAWAITTVLSDITLIGHQPDKLEIAKWRHLNTTCDVLKLNADILIEATGTPTGISKAMSICRPCGTIILKSTVASAAEINLTPIVVNELTLIGSRCGDFKEGLQMILTYPDMPIERLITARYTINNGVAAFNHANQRDTLKVFVDIS